LSLYVDGELDTTTLEQSGPILYPDRAPLVIGAYRDADENNLHHGRINEVVIYHEVAAARWVAHEFEHGKALAAMQLNEVEVPVDPDLPNEFLVRPFLQFATQTGITVTWETTVPGRSVLHWGTNSDCAQNVTLPSSGTPADQGFVHQHRLEELNLGTQYFYRVQTTDDQGRSVESEVYTFQTAVDEDTPFAFAAVGDTQGNLEVAGQIAELAWAQRPSFLLHAGDLVDRGGRKGDWTQTFFPSMHPLISRVPIFPVLGNHEDDAELYYHYMDLPAPEYYYTFTYGNTQFFMIDSNRNVAPGSEQYQWLDETLEASTATWKIVCHHHPPYSSDENDFGDLWRTNLSTRGNLRVRVLTTLYDKHDVDIVWNGHIHSYERTWPMLAHQPVDTDGTIYMITGGAGGGLENPGPFRTPFANVLRHGHHYTMVHVNGRTLEVRVYTEQGLLFDTFVLDKRGQ